MKIDSDYKKEWVVLIICVVLLIVINYGYLDSNLENFLVSSESKTVRVRRIIDGDTLTYNTENRSEISVRLLGINSPEKGEKFYSEARDFLKEKVLNKSVKLVYRDEKTDRYGRDLAYIFYQGENINKELVEEGYANYYFPSGRDRYYGDFVKAWENCLDRERNFCGSSDVKCSDCIELKRIDKYEQEVVFSNLCSFSCDLTKWSIKDEGRKKFVFPGFILDSGNEVAIKVGEENNTEDTLYWKGESYVWTSSGDTLFLRDSSGGLVLWKIIS